MCSVVRVMSVENVYIITCTQTYCMNWDWLEWKANMTRVKLQLVMMSVYVYCVIKVITSYAHQFQAPYVMHAWWSNTFRYLHIWCILIKINMLTGIVASCINPMICFMSIHTQFRMYCHYHHYNILYQNIITAKYHANIPDTGMPHCLYAWQHREQMFAVGHFPILTNSLTSQIFCNINLYTHKNISSMNASSRVYIDVVIIWTMMSFNQQILHSFSCY